MHAASGGQAGLAHREKGSIKFTWGEQRCPKSVNERYNQLESRVRMKYRFYWLIHGVGMIVAGQLCDELILTRAKYTMILDRSMIMMDR